MTNKVVFHPIFNEYVDSRLRRVCGSWSFCAWYGMRVGIQMCKSCGIIIAWCGVINSFCTVRLEGAVGNTHDGYF
jgi:hypothetical protein